MSNFVIKIIIEYKARELLGKFTEKSGMWTIIWRTLIIPHKYCNDADLYLFEWILWKFYMIIFTAKLLIIIPCRELLAEPPTESKSAAAKNILCEKGLTSSIHLFRNSFLNRCLVLDGSHSWFLNKESILNECNLHNVRWLNDLSFTNLHHKLRPWEASWNWVECKDTAKSC